jgi:hypothetical protein
MKDENGKMECKKMIDDSPISVMKRSENTLRNKTTTSA